MTRDIKDHEVELSELLRRTVRNYCASNGLKADMANDYRCPPLAVKREPVKLRMLRVDLLNALEACRVATSRESTRPYLNGVFIESLAHAPGVLTVVGTDGHRVCAAEIKANRTDGESVQRASAILLNRYGFKCYWPNATPRDPIKDVITYLRTWRLAKHVYLVISDDAVEIAHPGAIENFVRFDTPDATYPDWRRCLPRLDGLCVTREFEARPMRLWFKILKGEAELAGRSGLSRSHVRLSDDSLTSYARLRAMSGHSGLRVPLPSEANYSAHVDSGSIADLGLNAQYLADFIPKSGKVKIVTSAEYGAGAPSTVICPDGYARAIMPLRL